jgi:hypothetical protein
MNYEKDVAEAFENARIEDELDRTEAMLRMLRSFDVTATLSRVTDTDGKPHPAVVLTPDQNSAMIELIQQAATNQFTL